MPTMPIKTYLQGWDAHAPGKQRLQLVSNDVTTLEGQVGQAWADNTAKTRAQLKARIESPVEYKNDEYRGYDTVCQLAPSGSLTIGSGGLDKYGNPNLTFFYATSGSVEFTATSRMSTSGVIRGCRSPSTSPRGCPCRSMFCGPMAASPTQPSA